MSKNSLKITKKVFQIALSFVLIVPITACSNKKDTTNYKESSVSEEAVTEPPEMKEDQVPVIVPETPKENYSDENQVVDYFEEMDDNLDKVFTKENYEKTKNKVKKSVFTSMVTTVEFLNNRKEIGGYYFNDLTDPTKQKIMEIADQIDQKIVEHYPDYKEYIKEKWDISYEKYQDLKDKAKDKIKNYVGEDTYNSVVEAKDKVKEKVKEKTNDYKESIKNWYQRKKEEYGK